MGGSESREAPKGSQKLWDPGDREIRDKNLYFIGSISPTFPAAIGSSPRNLNMPTKNDVLFTPGKEGICSAEEKKKPCVFVQTPAPLFCDRPTAPCGWQGVCFAERLSGDAHPCLKLVCRISASFIPRPREALPSLAARYRWLNSGAKPRLSLP